MDILKNLTGFLRRSSNSTQEIENEETTMSEIDNQTPPVETPPATPPAAPAITPEQVSEWLAANNYTAAPADDPVWKFQGADPSLLEEKEKMPNPPDYDPYDPNSVKRIVDDTVKDMPKKLADQVSAQVMTAIKPMLDTLANNQLQSSIRPEAKPFVDEILKEHGVTPFQASQDPKVMRLVNEAAEARALKAGKLAPAILFPSEPPTGTPAAAQIGEDVQQMLAMSENFLGRPLREEERAVRIKEFEAAKRREGYGDE